MQSPYFFDYQPNTRTKTEVQLTRKLVVKASDIRKMDEEARAAAGRPGCSTSPRTPAARSGSQE